jgi:WXXGXW repeat (2 copies)
MQGTSRKCMRAAVAIALLVGFGAEGVMAQPVVIERGAMPAPRVEVIPVAPGAGYNWVPGHWAWRGTNWAWIPGHHIRGVVAPMPVEIVEVMPARPSPGHVWIKGHHVFEGGRWVWHPGVWIRL